MIDTDFGDTSLPPKWRSSMAVSYYVVPEDETSEDYPNERIVYLRLTCSITGWNPDEEIQALEEVIDLDDLPDDLQESIFDAFTAEALSEYAPCTSAIAQVAVYPLSSDDVGPDEFPTIIASSPTKRELYETRSESGEYLSSSSEDVNVKKGTTTLDSTERTNIRSGGWGFSLGAGPASVNVGEGSSLSTKQNTDVETVDMKTTDTSRQERETNSYSTTFNQMYQLFNAYHVGTNRNVFYMQARPHTVTESPEDNDEEDPRQVEHNLINGERKLEGLQDMFLVVSVPESLDGICLQANLDTGHTVDVWEFGDVGGKWEARRLLVTRRIINNCATFDDDGDLVPTGVPGDGPTLPIDDLVVYEDQLAKPVFEFMEGPPPPTPDTGPRTTFHSVSGSAFPMTGVSRRDRVKMANYMNLTQQQVQRKMLRGFTGNRYEPRPLEETETFDRLVRSVVAGLEFELDQLVEMEYVEDDEFEALRRAGVGSTRELFATDIEERLGEDERDQLEDIRGRMTANTHDILAKAREDRGNGE